MTEPVRSVRPPDAADLAAAADVVARHLAPTPLVPAALPTPGQDESTVEVLLKLETLQPTGSFKVRGALAALDAYRREHGPDVQVVTASAGNHGLGVAFAAARLGVAATVVVPLTASPAKVAALQTMDIALVEHGNDYEASERHALAIAAETNAIFVSPYNDPHVVAGQSTMAAEIGEQLDTAGQQAGRHDTAVEARDTGDGGTALVVPVGGGGLIAGTASWMAEHSDIRLVGVEAAASAAVSAAVAAGEIVRVPIGETLADGLGGNLEPGNITPALAAPRVERFVQVSEDEIAQAIRALVTYCGVVAEGAAAVGAAAVMTRKVSVSGSPPVVVVTGRNIAPALLARVLSDR